jgi:hypothetical protein
MSSTESQSWQKITTPNLNTFCSALYRKIESQSFSEEKDSNETRANEASQSRHASEIPSEQREWVECISLQVSEMG